MIIIIRIILRKQISLKEFQMKAYIEMVKPPVHRFIIKRIVIILQEQIKHLNG